MYFKVCTGRRNPVQTQNPETPLERSGGYVCLVAARSTTESLPGRVGAGTLAGDDKPTLPRAGNVEIECIGCRRKPYEAGAVRADDV